MVAESYSYKSNTRKIPLCRYEKINQIQIKQNNPNFSEKIEI